MEVPRHWRLKQQRYALVGASCTHCGAPNLAQRPVCLQCGGVIGQDTVLGHKLEPAGLPVSIAKRVSLPTRGG